MDRNLFDNSRALRYFALLVIVFVTFFPFFYTGFGCADDLQNFLIYKAGREGWNKLFLARFSGRFYYLITHPVYLLPYVSDSPFVIKLFHHLPSLLGIGLAALILYRMTRSQELAFFFIVVFLTVAQASKHTSLFLCYPFYFTFSFDLMLVSFLCLITGFDTSRKYLYVLSVFLFLAVILFSEIYLVYLLFFAITIFVHFARKETGVWRIIKRGSLAFLPFLACVVVYVVAYFVYRSYHPSQYPGTTLHLASLGFTDIFNALWNLSWSSYPLTVFEENRQLFSLNSELVSGHSPIVLQIILNARPEWIIKGVCVALVSFLALSGGSRLPVKTLLAVAGVAILLIFLPNVPLAFSEKYLRHVEVDMKGYIPTFFSLFGTVLLLSLLLGYLARLADINRFVRTGALVLISSGLFVVSVLTDLNNYTVAKDVRRANHRLFAIDELLKTPEFLQIPPYATFYTENLYRTASSQAGGLTEQGFRWDPYFAAKTGHPYQSFRKFSDIPVLPPDSVAPVYFIASREAARSEEVLLILARLPGKATAGDHPAQYVNEVFLLYYSAYKTFTVTFKTRDSSAGNRAPVYINHRPLMVMPGRSIELMINNRKDIQPATFFRLEAPGIDLNSISVSDIVNKDCPSFTLMP
jgi:hypothetical protein